MPPREVKKMIHQMLAITYGNGGGGSSAGYWVVVAIVAVVVIAAAGWLFLRMRGRSSRHSDTPSPPK
jgi:hypothetical protein